MVREGDRSAPAKVATGLQARVVVDVLGAASADDRKLREADLVVLVDPGRPGRRADLDIHVADTGVYWDPTDRNGLHLKRAE
jgi:hypothetical protein